MLLFLLYSAASIRAFLWFLMVTGLGERIPGSLVLISWPLSIPYLSPLHWTVVHICCHENRPHLFKSGGHVLSPFTAAQQSVSSSTYGCLCGRLIWLRIYRTCLCLTGHWLIQMQSWNRESWDGASSLLLLCWTSCGCWCQPDLCGYKRGFCGKQKKPQNNKK